MAKVILMKGGSGGVTSSDVTASKAQVLQGYRTITSDSDDEVVEGTIPDKGVGDISAIMDTQDASNGRVSVDIPEGYYHGNNGHPWVWIGWKNIVDILGIDKNKIVSSATYAGVTGAVIDKGNGTPENNTSGEMFYYEPFSGYVVRFEPGAYYMLAQWKPVVKVPVSLVKSAVNYHPEKTLNDTVTCNERGTVAIIDTKVNDYNVNASKGWGIDTRRGKFWITLGHGNAYYCREDNSPHVDVPATELGTAGADSVLQWQTASSQQGIKFEGSIPRWICTTGGVITALNNEGFVWDDSSGANRGRGIVTRIPDKHFIQDANYVFLASPNFYPQNLVKNININGITGTRDYIDLISPTWLSDTHLNLTANTVEKEIHIPNKFLQYNGLFMKVIVWGIAPDGYYKNSNGGVCPCVIAVSTFDGGATFETKIGAGIFYGLLERQGNGFNDFRLKYRGTMNFNLSMNFLITEGFSHQWAGNYAT